MQSFSQNDSNLAYPFSGNESGGLYMNNPTIFNTYVEFDAEANQYLVYQRIGDRIVGFPSVMSFEEYEQKQLEKLNASYWDMRSGERKVRQTSSFGLPKLFIPGQAFDRLFGGNSVDIRPQGSAELIFSLRINRLDNPSLPEEQRKTTSFDFEEKIQMNVIGKIGEKLKLTTNYNTESTFDFENKMKLEYTGGEDEIIKKLEVGNVSLPLNGTLITGSTSLFGMKAQLQFGRTTITSILSQQKSKTSEVEVSGGAQTTEFDIYADDYEANKHFFLAHYFKNQYDDALANLPFVNSSINITKIEVWITNKTGTTNNTRNIVSFLDLGETEIYNNSPDFANNVFGQYPDNDDANDLYINLTKNFSTARDINQVNNTFGPPYNVYFKAAYDYEKLERARQLTSSEYTLHPQLGYISLNQALNNDEVLAVAFQYTIGSNTYQVGELSTTGPSAPDALFVKLLKGTNFSTQLPNWDLMMKNVYAIGGYQMSQNDFILDVVYENTEESGGITNYIPEGVLDGIPLIKVLNLDNLNSQQDKQSDGVFDFIEGITAKSSNGRIIFPVREPFGTYLKSKFSDPNLAQKYVYQALYDSTLTIAQQYPELNKFRLKGSYQASSGAEISLNAMNVPEGSVTVTAGSQKLTENQDYTVDYMLGRVTIINQGILNSGVPIKISLENNALYGIQNKTLIGTHIDYEINKDFIIGGTVLNLTERPYTTKINTGDEPISNTIWGLDGTYQKNSPFITKMVDKLPFLETKAKSSIIATAEFAHLIPGHHKSLGNSGVSYIDDFEASKTGIDMKNMGAWFLSSIPQGQENIFQNANENDNLISGYQRAKVAWYTIDPLFYRNTSVTPPGVNKSITLPNGNSITQQSYHYSREVLEKEVFPNKDPDLGSQISNLALLDVAYYPTKRGPYNYNVNELNADGSLQNPSDKWAGLMRKVETNDFEAANIEFIEFWMMDPFNAEDGDNNHSGGDLYFHLGNISEDILKDGYKSFENGLPSTSTVENVDTTVWGRVPTNFSIVNAFDNDPNSRDFQDVGLDGLRTSDEKLFFDNYLQQIANNANLGTASQAYLNAEKDPSADNYHYYRGSDFDNNQTKILDRYLNFNNMDGNSVTTDKSPESYPTSSTTIPNTEDINKDNTLSESESYFQYKVPLYPNMDVGDSYISDVFTANVKTENGANRPVKWYQFRVPIYKPDKIVGGIQDFKSIRFMRIVLSDFQQPIVCRFATLDLVRGEWRRYNFDLATPGEYIPIDDEDNTLFDVTAVNVEENGKRSPINYVIPPGIEQEIDNTTTTLRRQNEQSLVLKVCDLKDGDSRAAYKTADLDVRSYKRIKMFVHAEGKNDDLNDGDFSCFIRLGTDFISNYYEYEVSLKATPHGASSTNTIWPSSNQIDIAFEEFQKAKQIRNDAIRDGSHSNVSHPFIKYLANGKKIQIVGNPNLARVKTIMIGIRNPKKINIQDTDDGLAKCGEIWVNELRLTDFDEYGGWAANSRLTTRLADFSTITFAGSMSTIGFGSIEKKINERQRFNAYQYDVSSTFEMGKFFPEDYGVKIPMYVGVSEAIENPQYNPLDPDILFKTTLATLDSKVERDSLKHIAQDYVKRKSINFTNVRKMPSFNKEKGKNEKPKKSKVYDIENFSLSYSFNETFIRNINTEYNKTKLYRGAINYNFHTTPKNVKPFSKLNLGKSKYMRLIKDFNFNTMPKSFSFRTDLDRNYNETKLRNINNSNMLIFPTYNKYFNWNRMYEIKYDLTRTLKVDLAVNNRATIDEPEGSLSKDAPDYKAKRDTLWRNFWDFGRPTMYRQTTNINYQVPINKIPFLDFLSLNTRYSANYDWTGAAKSLQYLGNNIQNSNTKQYNGQINLNTLYNKVPYFRKVNQSPNRGGRNQRQRNNQQSDQQEEDENRYEFFKYMTRFMLSVKNVSINYSENRGTFLPGFMPKPHFLGQQWSMMAPGLPFVFGSQNDIRYKAASEGWLTTNPSLNTLYKTNFSSNLTLRSTLEPFRQFRIELTANKSRSLNSQEYWRADNLGSFQSFSPIETGGFSVSIISWSTAFLKDDEQYSSRTFTQFRNYRNEIAKRLAAENPDFNGGINPLTGYPIEYVINVTDTTYTGGYGPTSQDVIIPAFLAAYTGKDALGVSLRKFPKIPLPNWRITYDGLSKLKFIKRYFETFTLGHAYRSTYSVGSFSSNLDYKDENGDVQMNLNNMSYHTKYDIGQVSINEQFSPLFKMDMTWKNSLLARFELKKSRMLSLSLSNNQLTEISSNEYVIGIGYRVKDVSFNFRAAGRSKKMSSDLDLKLDLNIRNNRTVIRKVIEDVEQITAGQQIISIKFSADYVINQRLNVKAFYDQVITNPFLSTTFPGSITNAGFSIRFTLAG